MNEFMDNDSTLRYYSSIKDWYLGTYPDDELGQELKDNVTFSDLFDAIDYHQDVYETLGVGDSIIRERCFTELADIIGESYEYIYEYWTM